MKQFKLLCLVFTLTFTSNSLAFCNIKNNSDKDMSDLNCDITFDKTDKTDKTDNVDYDVTLIDSCSNKKIFQESEMNSTMETLSLEKSESGYVLLKEYFGNNKILQLLSFNYKGGEAKNLYYYIFESNINFEKRSKEWSGEVCNSSNDILPPASDKSLLVRFSSLCNGGRKLKYHSYTHGDDVFF